MDINSILHSLITNPLVPFIIAIFVLALLGAFLVNIYQRREAEKDRADYRKEKESERNKPESAKAGGLGSILGARDEKKPEEQIRTEAITIESHKFNPQILTIPAGTTIIWTNKDEATHNIRSSTFSSENLAKGDSYIYKFS